MTIVAAAISPEDGIWIGSDGRSMSGDLINGEDVRKWSVSPCGNWALSHSGDILNIEAVEEVFALPSFVWPETHDVAGARRLLRSVREGLEAFPLATRPVRAAESAVPNWYWAPIVASPLGIWRADSTLWSPLNPIQGAYLAGGSGQDFAYGAMAALFDRGINSARQLVTAAISAACRLTPGCGGEQRTWCFAPPLATATAIGQAVS